LERPGVGHNDENVILRKRWWVKHHIVTEKTGNSACAADRYVSLELGASPVSHLLAAHHPRIHMNGKDDENLELMRTSERRFRRIARVDKGRKLYEAAAFLLSVGEAGSRVVTK
jgi:hypothetical protein